MASVTCDRITKVFAGGVTAVDDVSLSIDDGEFMVLVGPSGCGKSTMMRIVAGLEQVSAGRVLIGDDDVTALDPPDRDIAMVFQSYALYPHKTVQENLAFGLRRRRVPRDEIGRRVDAMARMLGLDDLLQRKPAALSGGQRQRVAMGRALVREPQAFLMDEPLSNLDAKLRTAMRGELARLHERLPTTTIYVTHDQVEAMTLGHRVAVLRDGRIQQCDTPQRLFEQPANLFVGAFIGSPAMNLVRAEVEGAGLRIGPHVLRLPAPPAPPGRREVVLGIRPTSFALASGCDPAWPRLPVAIDVVEALGDECNVLFTVEAESVDTEDVRAAVGDDDADDEGRLFADDRRARLTARLFERPRFASGERIELALDPGQLHVFDVETGVALRREADLVGAA